MRGREERSRKMSEVPGPWVISDTYNRSSGYIRRVMGYVMRNRINRNHEFYPGDYRLESYGDFLGMAQKRVPSAGDMMKEAEVLQQENEVLKDEVGELKKVLYSLQDEVRSRLNVIDVENVENIVQYQNVDYTYHNQNL
ncbi:hypothetical protein GCK32_007875 [Trichostrongylus colubriformis]|uniref:Uncharacterized protein n=1 Tax=Trichostrongylus colubriformis TaxID=6319 RepID=A0AAN8FAB3_TRICO